MLAKRHTESYEETGNEPEVDFLSALTVYLCIMTVMSGDYTE